MLRGAERLAKGSHDETDRATIPPLHGRIQPDPSGGRQRRAARVAAEDLLDLAPPSAAPPPEVEAFVERLAGCNHWAAEEATDAERGAAIAQARFRLRCSTIEQDEGRLRARFAKSPGALEALDQAGSSDE